MPRSITSQTWRCPGSAEVHYQCAYRPRTRVPASHWNQVRQGVALRCALWGGDAHRSYATTVTHRWPRWRRSNCLSGPCSCWSRPTFVRSKAMPTSPPLARSTPWRLRSPNHLELLCWEQHLLYFQCPG